MPAALDPAKRAAILDDIKAGQNSCRGIARKHGVSDHVVRKIADENHIKDAWSRAQTKKATEANIVDHKARLSIAARRSLGVYETIIASYEKMTAAQWAKVSPRDRGIIAGIMADKTRDLEPADDNGAGHARSVLGDIAAALRVAVDQLPADES